MAPGAAGAAALLGSVSRQRASPGGAAAGQDPLTSRPRLGAGLSAVVVPRRGLGWLLGPPPEPGSKAWWKKWNRLSALVVVPWVAYRFYNGNFAITLFDDQGNLAPNFVMVTPAEMTMREARETFEREVEGLRERQRMRETHDIPTHKPRHQ